MAEGLFNFMSLLGYMKSTWSEYGEFVNYIGPPAERRLGATERGYLCLLPKLAKPGDQLVILKGARVPAIVRPLDGWFEFIGEAYVHGIMNGELFDEGRCVKLRIR